LIRSAPLRAWVERLGLSRRELRAWALSASSTAALALGAVLSPLFGVIADRWPVKKKLLGASAALGVLATLGLALVGPGDVGLAAALFAAGNIGLLVSFVFYDALLPHIAAEAEADRVSSAGCALGHLGGGLLLLLNLAWIQRPGLFGFASTESACRASFASVALWWAVFSIPLLRRVREPAVAAAQGGGPVPGVAARLAAAGRQLRAFPQALLLLS
jgi:UMF1 family MFS transporter